ncbi:MAG: AmmeMemoRadiSam system protein A [Anaerolineae bacterium]|jgi:uncharacterized protein|nr:AmmeMemoRadiSam system protein A [Anaerolineae bacterium]MBT7783840.1 AmmeMemoRadiSam system protein A [Anaerolineae bacterium]
MDRKKLTSAEKEILLKIARRALEEKICGDEHLPLNAETQATPLLQADGATFVTLRIKGELRGCVGTLEAYRPLTQDVRKHALAAALNDHRFLKVQAHELDQIDIEISRLTPPAPLDYIDADDLLKKLRPNIDGVIIKDGHRRATFLPQVWEQLPKTEDFLYHLCKKMGGSGNLWQDKKLDILIYQVEEFKE